MNKLGFFVVLVILTGCAVKTVQNNDHLTSIQVVDRNGFSETISNQERLGIYQNVDFLSNQPYQKVMRVFGKDNEGKSHTKITSYHANGQVWQYLEILDGRAHGTYQEWHENGNLKIECTVIEGMADVSPLAQAGWIFEGKSRVWDEAGHLIADIHYEKGVLQGLSSYYHTNGQLWKAVPYERDLIDGKVMIYNEKGEISQKIPYKKGLRHGIAIGRWTQDISWYVEHYKDGLLLFALYHDPSGKVVAEIKEGEGIKAVYEKQQLASFIHYQNGKQEGQVKLFNSNGSLASSYFLKDGKKHGEEWEYYPNEAIAKLHASEKSKILTIPCQDLLAGPTGGGEDILKEVEEPPPGQGASKGRFCAAKNFAIGSNAQAPKLLVSWYEDRIEGLVKTWYENGNLESQREMSNNKKHGLCFAYYRDSQLMLMEEYDNDKLVRGSYFKRGDKIPISKIEDGFGTATLYNPDGHLIQKVIYEKGNPLIE